MNNSIPCRPAALLVCLLLLAVPGLAQRRGPSTPEERARAVKIARALESEPLAKGAKQDREWFLLWLIEVPDISVNVCSNMLGPVVGAKKNHATEIFSQTMFSAAAFIIENPDKAKDDYATYLAGVEGALKTYEAILKTKPKGRFPFLDDLIAKRDRGELGNYVRETMAKCKPQG